MIRYVFFTGLLFVALGAGAVQPDRLGVDDANVISRGRFENAWHQFTHTGKGHVAFIGGSITEMNGYRPMVIERLKERFPKTDFHFTSAGIASTCSTTGAFRLQDHVLKHGPVDLFFVEFVVNDDQDAGHTARDAMRGMEGLIRHTRAHNPHADIVITFFVNPGMLEQLSSGKTPMPMQAHTKVAEHYQIPVIHLARQVAQSIDAGKLSWKQFGGTHPKPYGNRIAADLIERLMQTHWDTAQADRKYRPHLLPDPLDPMNYQSGRLVSVADAKLSGDAKVGVPDWKLIPGSKRSRFTSSEVLCLDRTDQVATLSFTGTAIGVFVVAGPDAAVVQSSVDGAPWTDHDLYHRFSQRLHYPRTVVFAADLDSDKPHELRLRLAPQGQQRQEGTAARILYFVAN